MSRALTTARAAMILAGLSLRRLFRSRVIWISAIVAMAPLLVQVAAGGTASMKNEWRDLYSMLTVVLAIIPALHMAPAVAEEIEDRTFTYLWSRPFPRRYCPRLGGRPGHELGRAALARRREGSGNQPSGGSGVRLARSCAAPRRLAEACAAAAAGPLQP